MPNIPLSDLNYSENTHNVITSNASAKLIIDMVKKYITNNLSASTTPLSTSSSSSSDDMTCYSLSVQGDAAAEKRVADLIGNYLSRNPTLLQKTEIAYLEEQTKPTNICNNLLDKVTFIDNGTTVSWYLPRREVFAAVIAAIMDTSTDAWPIDSRDANQEQIARLNEFDKVNHALFEESNKTANGTCSTGVRHTWIQALDGYAGQELPFGDRGIILRTIRNTIIKVLCDEWNVTFPNDKDPSAEELVALQTVWTTIFLPWLINGSMPQQLLDKINLDDLKNNIMKAYADIYIAPDSKLIDAYSSAKSLSDLCCDLMPFLATLSEWITQYTLSLCINNANKSLNSYSRLAAQVFAWLQNDFFRHNPARDIQIFYRIERLLGVFNLLKKGTIDTLAIDNKHDYFLALDYFEGCYGNAALSLNSFLATEDDNRLLDKHLYHFEQGYRIVRETQYRDFITNFFSSWFAGDDTTRARLFRLLAELYFADLEAIEKADGKPVIFLADAMLSDWLSAEQDNVLDIDIYSINRILLHALNFPAAQWSDLFLQTLKIVLDFIDASFNATEKNQRLQKLRRDAYPEHMIKQIRQLITPDANYSLMSQQIIVMPANVSSATSLAITTYLVKSDAPITLIKKLIRTDNGFDLKAVQQTSTPLLIACHYNKIEMVKYFLFEMNGDIRQQNRKGDTPLHITVSRGHLELTLFLLMHGARDDLLTLNKAGYLPSHLATITGNQPMFASLLYHGADINAQMLIGYNCLHYAVMNKDFNLVSYLLRRGANIHLKTSDNLSVLDIAMENFNLPVFKLLLNSGVKVNEKNHFGMTALHRAVYFQNRDARAQIITCLLAANADLNVQNCFGVTALASAVYLDRYAEASSLLLAGANANIPNNQGATPLHEAIRMNLVAIVNLLLGKRACVNQADHEGNTALHIAGNNTRIVNKLIAYGADYTRQNHQGDTILHILATATKAPVLKTFPIEIIKTIINLVNQAGDTALHIAAKREHFSVGNQLLELGADINARDAMGNTALALAVLNNNINVVRQLLKHNADMLLSNYANMSPRDIAISQKNEVIIKALTNAQMRRDPFFGVVSNFTFFQPHDSIANLCSYAKDGRLADLKHCLENNHDVEGLDFQRNTALSLASQHGHLDIVNYLESLPPATKRGRYAL